MITTVRSRWLAAASAGGAALGHLLDELGALPGVHESREVRVAVLDPARGIGIALALTAAIAAGLAADRLLDRSRRAAVVLLTAGQLAVAAGMESVARGRLEVGPLEHGGVSAIAVQLAVALLVVAAATITAHALARLPRVGIAAELAALHAPTRRAAQVQPVMRASCQGRAPPLPLRALAMTLPLT